MNTTLKLILVLTALSSCNSNPSNNIQVDENCHKSIQYQYFNVCEPFEIGAALQKEFEEKSYNKKFLIYDTFMSDLNQIGIRRKSIALSTDGDTNSTLLLWHINAFEICLDSNSIICSEGRKGTVSILKEDLNFYFKFISENKKKKIHRLHHVFRINESDTSSIPIVYQLDFKNIPNTKAYWNQFMEVFGVLIEEIGIYRNSMSQEKYGMPFNALQVNQRKLIHQETALRIFINYNMGCFCNSIVIPSPAASIK